MSNDASLSLTERLADEFASGKADLERPAQLPGIPAPTEDLAAIVRSVRALKTVVDTLTGTGGSVLDKAVTTREVLQEGVAVYTSAGGISGGGSSGVVDPGYEDPRPVLGTPPTPSNLTAVGAFANIILDWDLLNYRNHAFTEVLRATTNNAAVATVIGTAVANQYVDATAAVGVTYYYWVRAVNLEAVTGPVNSATGTPATLAVPPGALLDALTGQITESQLFGDLADRIDLIDGSGPGSVNARVQAEANTRASAVSGIEAKYTVKVDIAGYVAGYGLIATANEAAPTSSFGVRADQFFVAPPTNYNQATAPASPTLNQLWRNTTTGVVQIWNGSAWVAFNNNTPFVIRTTGVTENGVSIPPGTYIDAAYIVNLSALNARIGSLIADDIAAADISAAQLTSGTIRVGAFIQSQSYSAGVSGWRINADGTAEFNNVTVRGTVFASAGSFTGAITANSGSLGSLSVNGNLTMGTGGVLRAGKTGYTDTVNAGWAWEYNGGTPRFIVSNDQGGIRWTGSLLEISGVVVKNSNGVTLLNVQGAAVAPWVTYVAPAAVGSISLVDSADPATNTVRLKNLQAGEGVELTEDTPGAVTISVPSQKQGVLEVANELSTSTTTLVNIPNLSIEAEANAVYLFEALVRAAHSNTAAQGVQIECSFPSDATVFRMDSIGTANQTAGDNTVPVVLSASVMAAASGTLGSVGKLRWLIVMGATAQRLNFRFARTNTSGIATIKRGSWFSIEKLTRTLPQTGTLVASPAGIPATPAKAEKQNSTSIYRITVIATGVDAGKLRLERTRLVSSNVTTDYTVLATGVIGAFDVKFEVTGTTDTLQPGSVVTRTNGAADYVQCNVNRVYYISVTNPSTYTTSVTQTVVAVKFRDRDSGALQTMQTITLNVEASSVEPDPGSGGAF